MQKLAFSIKTAAKIYEQPFNGTLVDELLYGMPCVILTQVKNYYYIKTFYGYSGYINTNSLKIINDNFLYNNLQAINSDSDDNFSLDFANSCLSHTKGFFTVTAPCLDVLSRPDVKGKILLSLPRGAIVKLKGKCDENGWQCICLHTKKHGFVKSEHIKKTAELIGDVSELKKESQNNLRNKICDNALLYLGTQYRWGGKTPFGIDCSGLSFMAYLQCGIIIYRDAKIKENYPLKEIKYSEINRGDLLYFPGHVALYLGGGEFVHATAQNGNSGVIIESFNKGAKNYRQDLHKSLYACTSLF